MFDDPFGHRWNIATHIEDVSPEQMEQRVVAAMVADNRSQLHNCR
jgi:PhnB protein